MTDRVPSYENHIAQVIGILFHPFVIAPPTLWAVLQHLPPQQVLSWSALILLVLITPLAVSLVVLRRRGKYVYQRRARLPIYVIAWASILLGLILTAVLQAPPVLIACMAALALWLPLQFAINTWLTKISIHAAVITGCVTGLLLLGVFPSAILQILAIAAIALTAWARIATDHHTPRQVLLGILVGAFPVLLVFPMVLHG